MNTQKTIWNTLRLIRKAWIRHLMRNSPLITTEIEETIKGKPGKGRPRIPFLKQVIEDTGIVIYWKLKRNISNREKWRETSLII